VYGDPSGACSRGDQAPPLPPIHHAPYPTRHAPRTPHTPHTHTLHTTPPHTTTRNPTPHHTPSLDVSSSTTLAYCLPNAHSTPPNATQRHNATTPPKANITGYKWLRYNFDRYHALGVEVHLNAVTISINGFKNASWSRQRKFDAQATWYALLRYRLAPTTLLTTLSHISPHPLQVCTAAAGVYRLGRVC
jgi:hypothetical protein